MPLIRPPANPATTPLGTGPDLHSASHHGIVDVLAGPIVENVLGHGAKGDDVADDTAAFQAAFNAAGTRGRPVWIPGDRTYYVASPVNLPKLSGQGRIAVFGYGARVRTDQAINIFNRSFVDRATAAPHFGDRFTFYGLNFVGSSLAGQRGIELQATYGSRIQDCSFTTLDDGFVGRSVFKTKLDNCMGFSNIGRTWSFRDAADIWADATVGNTASNHSVFDNCRDLCAAGQVASFFVRGSMGCVVRDCISEGLNPQHNIRFEHNNNARSFYVENFHSENSPSVSRIHAPAFNQVVIAGFQVPDAAVIAVDGRGSVTDSLISIVNIPRLAGGATFAADNASQVAGAVWEFSGIGGTSLAADLWQASFWTGVVPFKFIQRRAANMGGFYGPALAGRHTEVVGERAALRGSLATLLRSRSVAPGDTALNAEDISFFRDEATNVLKVKVKYTNGTVKVGDVANLV